MPGIPDRDVEVDGKRDAVIRSSHIEWVPHSQVAGADRSILVVMDMKEAKHS